MNIFIKYFVNIKNSRIFAFIKRTFKKRYNHLYYSILLSYIYLCLYTPFFKINKFILIKDTIKSYNKRIVL